MHPPATAHAIESTWGGEAIRSQSDGNQMAIRWRMQLRVPWEGSTDGVIAPDEGGNHIARMHPSAPDEGGNHLVRMHPSASAENPSANAENPSAHEWNIDGECARPCLHLDVRGEVDLPSAGRRSEHLHAGGDRISIHEGKSTCHQRSSVVISGHQWSSAVISCHPRSSVGKSTCMASDAKCPMYAPFKSMAIRRCVRSGMQKKRSTVGLP